MTDKRQEIDDAALEALLAGVRDREPVAPPALMARVLADAAAIQTARAAAPAVRAADTPPGLLARLLDVLGGWQGASALAASACVGLLLGLSSPDAVMGYVPGTNLDSADVELTLFDSILDTSDLEG